MTTSRNDNATMRITQINITKMKKGYRIDCNGKQAVELPDATNFEFRVEKGEAPTLGHLYFGSESGDDRDLAVHVTFGEPCDVRISNGHPRCYVHIRQSE